MTAVGRSRCAAMGEIGRRATSAGVGALLIAGPHGVGVEGTICLADTARPPGTLAWQRRQVELNVPVDGRLSEAIAATAEEWRMPIALAGYAGNRQDQSVLPLDSGILTPRWFL